METPRSGAGSPAPDCSPRPGAIHLDLYPTGCRSIPAIWWLLPPKIIAALVCRCGPAASSPLAAQIDARFGLSILGSCLPSPSIGLFGFQEVCTPAGTV